MLPSHTTWTFPGRDEPAHDVWIPATDAAVPGVVLSGDLWARAGKGVLPALARELAGRGFAAVAVTPAKGRDAKAFATGTLQDRAEEQEQLLTALFERMVAPGNVDIRRIALVGHGLGGVVSIARAAEDERVRAAVAIGAPRGPRAFFAKEAIDAWIAGGRASLRDPGDGTQHELGPALYQDWKAREGALDHANAAITASRATGARVLWVHGTDDAVVNVDESRRAYWRHPEAGGRARLVEIGGASHDFGVPGELPLEPPAPLRKLADAVAEFLGHALGA